MDFEFFYTFNPDLRLRISKKLVINLIKQSQPSGDSVRE